MEAVEGHGFAAVGAVDHSGEHILLGELGGATLVCSDALHDVPGLPVNQRLMGIFKTEPLALRALYALLVL